MSSTFRKPQKNVYRSFLYLNGDDVLNALSSLEGGDVDEVLTRVAEEGGSELSGELDVKVAKGRKGKRKVRRLEEEIRRKRTEHSATTLLLKKLHDDEAIGVIEGDYDAAVYSELEENMVIQFVAGIALHPLHQVIATARGLEELAPTFGISPTQKREIAETATMLEKLTERGAAETKTSLIFAQAANEPSEHRLVVPVQSRYLLVPLDEFSGRATFVAHVERILPPGEEVQVVRLIKNSPLLPMEREGLMEALPNLLSAISEMGIEATMDDLVLQHPTVILKPLCIYK